MEFVFSPWYFVMIALVIGIIVCFAIFFTMDKKDKETYENPENFIKPYKDAMLEYRDGKPEEGQQRGADLRDQQHLHPRRKGADARGTAARGLRRLRRRGGLLHGQGLGRGAARRDMRGQAALRRAEG